MLAPQVEVTSNISGAGRVAMEYSPGNAIPYVSRVDAGTIETVRQCGATVVSSGDLAQRFEAIWSDEALATHVAASERLYRIKDRAFSAAFDAVAHGRAISEYTLQQQMVKWFEEEGLVTDSAPVVAVGANAGNPHYLPTAEQCRAVVPDEVLLLQPGPDGATAKLARDIEEIKQLLEAGIGLAESVPAKTSPAAAARSAAARQ